MRFKICISALLIASSAFAAPKFVSKDEFTSAVVGKEISSKDQKGLAFTATFKVDGTGEFQKQGKKAAKFKWTFDATTVCWDFGDFKECNKVEIVSPKAVNFYDAKSGKLNNAYAVK